MPTPFLALNYKTGSPQVKRVVTGTASNIGVASGVAETGGALDNTAHQRVIRFRGYETFVQVIGTTIQRSTDAGASWSTVHTDADLNAGVTKTGIYLVYVNGTATLVIFSQGVITTQGFIWTSTDGITWTKTGPFVNVAFTPPLQSVTLWRGSLYAITEAGASARILTINPASLTVGVGTFAGSVPAFYDIDMVVVNDRLFWCQRNSPVTSCTLYELVAGSQVTRAALTFGGKVSVEGDGAAQALFYDSASGLLVWVALASVGPVAWCVVTIDPVTFATTDITATVASTLGTPTSTAKARWMLDTSDPGSGATPNLFLYISNSATLGTPYTVFKWNGISAPPTSLGSGGAVEFAYPFGVQNGGSVFWTSGQRHIERLTATPVAGGVQYGFQLYSPNPSVDTVSVRWIYGNNLDEFPHTPFASLANPSAGSISGGNTITGLDAADNGATTFTVTWLAQTDGFAVGDYAKTTPEIFS